MDNRSIHLTDGREIQLVELKQRRIYEGRIEGLPTQRENRQILKTLSEDGSHSWFGHKPHVIQPVETLLEDDPDRPYPFGTPAFIPPILCIGRFQSRADDPCYYTELVVAWFQNDFAFPIAPEVTKAIAGLDWLTLSTEIEI